MNTTSTSDAVWQAQLTANIMPIIASFFTMCSALVIAYLQKKMGVRLSDRHKELREHLLEIKATTSRSNSVII